ncbi:3-oxo-tetronate kinase [Anaerotignum sp.]|uniref:3-oxo-tetronate kinase n=1 Tax=Anaerotignum sp. TaxID=2039241 RepID=UPI0027B88636|nr:3-oxo-tetronate kinase [Anaerotignum sp.]
MKQDILIGCVADDFTGASDAASFLMSKGMKTILFNGKPDGEIPPCQAVVIALKSRTQETKSAVADSMAAFTWLKEQGAQHLYFKYCSTFDSTKEGNIGPVVDAMLKVFGEKYTILCPALPVNKRTVENGILYVDGVPLSETHMKNHPLTPMWESEIAKLMDPQGKYQTLNVNTELLAKSKEEILAVVDEFGKDKQHFYIVPDYVNDENGTKIAEVFGDLTVLTGGSGILAPLAAKYQQAQAAKDSMTNGVDGKGIVLAGSCSKATLEQIADFQTKGYASYKIDPMAVLSGTETVDTVWDFVKAHADEEVLLYSSDQAENVAEIQKVGKDKIAALLEGLTAAVAERAVANGYTRIIVAGGETSSAVAKKLGYHCFEIGESIAPGVPIMAPLSNENIRIVLKSGNFGQTDFFARALQMTRK